MIADNLTVLLCFPQSDIFYPLIGVFEPFTFSAALSNLDLDDLRFFKT